MRKLPWALLCAVLVSCAGNPKPATASLAERRVAVLARDVGWIKDSVPILKFKPLFVWGTWRLQLEACSGLKRDGWPAFYIANISPLEWIDPTKGNAAFYAPSNQSIVFGLGSETIPWIVRHELLHWLTWPLIPPTPANEMYADMVIRTHPGEYFAPDAPCGHLVNPQS